MKTFTISLNRRRWLHGQLDRVMDGMVERQDLHGGVSEIVKPVETSVRGVNVEVDLSLTFTPLNEHHEKVPAAAFGLDKPECCGKGPYGD